VPNIPAEMGVRAEWAHNKKGLATKVVVVAGVSLGLFLAFRGRSAKDRQEPGKPDLIAAGTHETALGAVLQGRVETAG